MNTSNKNTTAFMVPDDTLYIHWQFHPAGVNKDTIWKKKAQENTPRL